MILGIGTDLIEIHRIRRFGAKRLARRILSEEEMRRLPADSHRCTEFVAGRFAAKEAVAKAAGTGIGGKLGFRDIVIMTDARGKPEVRLTEKSRNALGWGKEVVVHLSISHTESAALAFALAERR